MFNNFSETTASRGVSHGLRWLSDWFATDGQWAGKYLINLHLGYQKKKINCLNSYLCNLERISVILALYKHLYLIKIT